MLIDLVDSVEYTRSNCFTHQLHKKLHELGAQQIDTVGLDDAIKGPRPEGIVCRLKQRTLSARLRDVKKWAKDVPLVVFDQDPWEAFRDGSPLRGTYERVYTELNVKAFVVTSKWWVDLLLTRGYPAKFGLMGVLPEYCDSGLPTQARKTTLGFIGQVHSHRKRLFDELRSKCDLAVELVDPHGKDYASFLRSLSTIGIFIHGEDNAFTVDGKHANLDVGLWVKDIEAAARGCWSIRNSSQLSIPDHDNQMLRTFDDVSQVPSVIEELLSINESTRRSYVDSIKKIDGWSSTARLLISEVSMHT